MTPGAPDGQGQLPEVVAFGAVDLLDHDPVGGLCRDVRRPASGRLLPQAADFVPQLLELGQAPLGSLDDLVDADPEQVSGARQAVLFVAHPLQGRGTGDGL